MICNSGLSEKIKQEFDKFCDNYDDFCNGCPYLSSTMCEIDFTLNYVQKNSDIVKCRNCKYYDSGFCDNITNRNRGSGDEYTFYIGYGLTKDETENWFCADFELRSIQANE